MPQAQQSPTPAESIAIGYVRVSTHRQAAVGLSLEAQRDAIRKYCREKKLDLATNVGEGGLVIDPAVSGGRAWLRRPAGREVLAAARRRPGLAVVATSLDRFARRLGSMVHLVAELGRAGATLHAIREGLVVGPHASPTERLHWQLLAMIAEWERDTASRRAQEVFEWRRGRGLAGPVAALGYRLTPDGRQEPDEAERARLGRVLEIADHFGCGAAGRLVARLEGVTARNGAPFGDRGLADLSRKLRGRGAEIEADCRRAASAARGHRPAPEHRDPERDPEARAIYQAVGEAQARELARQRARAAYARAKADWRRDEPPTLVYPADGPAETAGDNQAADDS